MKEMKRTGAGKGSGKRKTAKKAGYAGTLAKTTASRKHTAVKHNKTNSIRNRKKSSRKAREQRKVLVIAGVLFGIVLVIGLCSYFGLKSAVDKVPKDTICDNIYIDSVDVSGMKAEEAKAALEQRLTEYQNSTVKLIAEEASAEVTLTELGFQMKNMEQLVKKAVSYGKTGSLWGRYSKIKALEESKKVFETEFEVDAEAITAVIAEKIPKLENAAKDATIVRENGQFTITDGVKGVAIDNAASAKIIETYMNETWSYGAEKAEIKLVTSVDEPKVTREQLTQIQNVLGKYTTHCGSGGGRVQNIVTGAKLINGSVIMPGEEFSADAAMRPYTFENGYAEAGSYENGKVVQSMGGGICQVSSTLYNACLMAELEITQRQPHSMTVGYVEPSMDAAIAGDYKDLKFKNNTESPIYVEGYVSGGYITFVIYGKETRPESRSVKYVSETLSTTPGKKVFVASDAALGSKSTTSSGHTGMQAQLWKVVYENGKEVSRDVINKSSYRSSETTIAVGTKSSSEEATKVMKDAIASQNEDKINAAIAEAKAIIAKEEAEAQKPSVPETTPPASNEDGTDTETQPQTQTEAES